MFNLAKFIPKTLFRKQRSIWIHLGISQKYPDIGYITKKKQPKNVFPCVWALADRDFLKQSLLSSN